VGAAPPSPTLRAGDDGDGDGDGKGAVPGSLYCGAMAETRSAAPVADPAACERLLRRIALADAAPWLHQEVARRMAERLAIIRTPPVRWLDWWGAWGGSAEAVATALPAAERVVVEPTEALAERSRQASRAPWWALRRRGVTVHTTAAAPEGQAPMLWANMVLHHQPEPQSEFAAWHRALAPDGFVMFSTLGPQTVRTLREVYGAIGAGEAHAPYADMHDLGDMLVHGGFADPVMDQETISLHWSTPEAALAELHALGMNLSPRRHAGLRTPRWRARLCQALGQLSRENGRIVLHFELVYGHAFKGQPRRHVGEPVVAPIALPRSRRSNP
jgi:malonyl-CoA O-methyltransferase